MSEIKVYLDHLCFSLFIVFASLIGLYIILYILSIALAPAGLSFGIERFSIVNNFAVILFAWLVISCALAAGLTVHTIRSRPKDDTVFTRRKQL